MSNLNTRKILFTIFVFVVVSLSCISCRFTPEGIPLDVKILEHLTNQIAGTYVTGELTNNTEHLEADECTPGALSSPGKQETLEFKDNKLIISDEDGERTYAYQSFGDQDFCRELDNGKIECVSNLGSYSYHLTVYESKNNLRTCFSGDRYISRIGKPTMPPDPPEDAVDINDEGSQDCQFSTDDCSFCGLSIPLSSSSASNNSYKMSIISGTQVEVTGHLTCDWQGDYKSENKTGTIMIYLNVYKFDNAQDAQILFNKFHNNAASMMPYCKNDDSCTIAIADFGEDRAYYVWENIYVGGSGELPSDHGANLARLITSEEKYYVLDLLVTHPELEIGNAWVSDTAESVEACVMNIINW